MIIGQRMIINRFENWELPFLRIIRVYRAVTAFSNLKYVKTLKEPRQWKCLTGFSGHTASHRKPMLCSSILVYRSALFARGHEYVRRDIGRYSAEALPRGGSANASGAQPPSVHCPQAFSAHKAPKTSNFEYRIVLLASRSYSPFSKYSVFSRSLLTPYIHRDTPASCTAL
jgi:hypothetical protein